MAMNRHMIWAEDENFTGWCGWAGTDRIHQDDGTSTSNSQLQMPVVILHYVCKARACEPGGQSRFLVVTSYLSVCPVHRKVDSWFSWLRKSG